MDTIVPDSINRYDSEQLTCLFSLALQEAWICEKSETLVGPACDYDDILIPLKPVSMLALAQDQEVRARLARL